MKINIIKNTVKTTLKFNLVVLFLLSVTSAMVSCNSAESNKEKTTVNQDSINQLSSDLTAEQLAEIEQFKEDMKIQIASNDKNMAEFKARIASQKEEERIESQKKLDDLDKKNTDLKKRFADFKANSKENWNSFKKEFNHDMDELGSAFGDLTKKNTK